MLTFYKTCPFDFSESIKSKALCYTMVQLFGIKYYIPITYEMKKLYGLSVTVRGEYLIANFKVERNAERMEATLREQVYAMYLQVRDTVGAEIEAHLHEQLTQSLSNVFGKAIEDKITTELDSRLPKELSA